VAFARFGRHSDVYVYEDVRGGFTCERCPTIGSSFNAKDAGEMATHLVTFHRARGDRVPDEAIAELQALAESQRG
jgi:hypothetical protein